MCAKRAGLCGFELLIDSLSFSHPPKKKAGILTGQLSFLLKSLNKLSAAITNQKTK